MKLLPAVFLALLLLSQPSPAVIRYVDESATGANNGTSWANAYPGLQSALTAAAAGDEIRVAQGTYYPSVDESGNAAPADPRTRTFFINKNLVLRGGFKVSNGVLEARDVDMHRTILSGDIGTRSNVSDNCYHVLLLEWVSNSCVVDGFYVQEGQADGADEVNKGGAAAYLRATGSLPASPHFLNCRFERNTGSRGAVLLEVYDNDDDTKFSNCRFASNFGATVSAFQSTIQGITTQNLTFDNCVFTRSTGAGSVMKLTAIAEFFADATIELNNCSFGGNAQASNPLIVPEAVTGATVTLRGRNSIFSNPDAGAAEMLAAVENSDTTIDLDYCFLGETSCAAITSAGTTVTCGGNMFYNTDPQFADAGRGTLLPTLGAPTIDAGQAATATSADYLGQPRPLQSGPDIGAYEFPGQQRPVLTVSVDALRRMVLSWSCLTGETYTIRRTRDFVDYEDFVTAYPPGGAKTWNLEYIANSVDIASIPKLFYQVERE